MLGGYDCGARDAVGTDEQAVQEALFIGDPHAI